MLLIKQIQSVPNSFFHISRLTGPRLWNPLSRATWSANPLGSACSASLLMTTWNWLVITSLASQRSGSETRQRSPATRMEERPPPKILWFFLLLSTASCCCWSSCSRPSAFLLFCCWWSLSSSFHAAAAAVPIFDSSRVLTISISPCSGEEIGNDGEVVGVVWRKC